MRHLVRHIIRFADIDAAGICFFPRIYEHLHDAFEDFFDTGAGVPYAKVIAEERIGFPVVKIDTEFTAPMRHGDCVDVEISVAAIGTKSFTCRYRLLRGKELCVTAHVKTAVIDLSQMRSVALPAHHRKFLSAYLDEA